MARNRHALLTPLTAVILLHHALQPASAETTLSIPAHLHDDVAAYLPTCAVLCLASFIDANYARGDDTDQYLTLDFVCAHRGRSGYTVAEGALQCLTAERSVGFCGDEAIDVKVNQICSGRKDVAKNRGGAMTATLRYASQSGVLTFAPITTSLSAVPIPTPTETSTTSTSSSTSSFSETTLMTATSTRSSPTITTTTPLSSQTTTSSPTSTPEAPAADTSSPPSFSKGQIAGITIGAICLAAGVAFGLILLVRFLLRRRRRHSGSTIGSFIGGGPPGGGGGGGHAGYMTARDTWGYGFDKTSNFNGSSSASWATREAPGMSRYPAMPAAATATASNSSSSSSSGHTKQQQLQQLHNHHQPYNRDSWRPSAIGLAISPSKLFASRRTPTPTSTPTRPRPLSKLLPAKPDMTPANAIRTGLSPPPPPPPPPPAATYQETCGAQASQQQSFLHPIAAQFMRPSAATAAAAARPTSLRLVIPDCQPLPPPPPPSVPEKELHLQRQPILGRESTLTEFEEDDLHRSASTAVGQIWRPPSLLPDSAVAAPYYVADGSGNWVLGDARKSMIAGAGAGAGASGKETMRPHSPEPESAVSAPRIATARSGIVTTAVQTHIMAPRRSPAMLTPRDETARATMDKHTQQQQQQQQHGNNEPQELEASPSLPLSRDKQRSAKQETTQLAAATPAPPKTPRIRSIVHTPKTVPSPLFSRQPNPRSASQPVPTTSEGRLFTVRPAPSRVMSDDSGITTFSVSSATSDDMPPPLPAPSNRNLSPVAESPRGRAAVQELINSNAAVHELAATVAATSDHSRSSSDGGGGGGGGASSASYPPRITGRSTPAPRGRAVLPGSVLSPPPPPRMALLVSQPSASQSSPTLGSVTAPQQGHANAASFQRQPLPSSPYHGAPEAARGGMVRGRGRGGSMMTMMRPPRSDMPRDPTLLAPPQVPQHPRTGSPTLRIVEPSPEPDPAHPTTTTTTIAALTRDDRSLLPSAAIMTRPPRRRPPSHLPHPFPMYPLRRNPPPQQQQQQQQQQSDSAPPPCVAPYPTSPPPPPSFSSPRRRGDNNENDSSSSSSSLSRYPGHPMPIPQPYKPRAAPSPSPRAALLRSDYDPAAHDNSSQEALADASSSSSLLAKRLGSTRAADMALPTQSNRERERRWQQVPQQQQAGEGRIQKRTQDTEYLATPELPSTPTWVPRLTPTRRGEDLVLNVG
ncbi:hypothetical protein MY1884_007493 [Beauveria asiatica]